MSRDNLESSSSQDSLASRPHLVEISLAQLCAEFLRLREENEALEAQFSQKEQTIWYIQGELGDANNMIGALQKQVNELYRQCEILSVKNKKLRAMVAKKIKNSARTQQEPKPHDAKNLNGLFVRGRTIPMRVNKKTPGDKPQNFSIK